MKKLLARLEVFIEDGCVTGLKVPITEALPHKPYELVLNPKEPISHKNPKPANLLDVVAHELGHFLQHVLETPVARKDDAEFENRPNIRNLTFDEAKRWTLARARTKYQLESEAWDIARKIRPALNEGQAEEALASYRDPVIWMERRI